ncbi:DUF6164 family protein [Methylomarinum sp. Ch1-1]|uniref:DUF6164 family protein n=1 Tax=Methylomarinum roseum TaxID=3067653 RepID=A0AAU7NSX9_9GAMM|nr:DUF6164 family protein [Methylomarinum sp. Ch1-1]MDP4519982.1 DUF6164 family protein [Methylomarinum sp. Ch1-1]
MSTLLFSLQGVPEDEADEVRALLSDNGIDFYETSAGNWGISMPALWLRDPDELPTAQRLLHAYQQKRCAEQRALYEQLKKEGKNKRLFDVVKEKPLQFLLYSGFIALIVYVSIKLLFELGL